MPVKTGIRCALNIWMTNTDLKYKSLIFDSNGKKINTGGCNTLIKYSVVSDNRIFKWYISQKNINLKKYLRNARYEMDAVLFRTAMSPGIREQGDCFPMIANRDGKMVVGLFGSFIHGFTQGFNGDIEDGDIFLTNDPYSCQGAISHLNDWLTLMPT